MTLQWSAVRSDPVRVLKIFLVRGPSWSAFFQNCAGPRGPTFRTVDPWVQSDNCYYKRTSKEIEDSNDNFPIFERDSYSFSIIENSPNNTYIGVVIANDADSDSFGTVSYSISSTEKFYIDDQGKLYTISTIDRETRASYQLRVTAIDGGKKRLLALESNR